ncbi:MAG: discoidin domain-containing protein, partial [Candidatus Hydrogenedentes bacterium]|nr:discoidin domain-containing protein [Candidatus Hydrogenedentota bacterium]
YTPHEDYTCGEQNVFQDIPVQRFIDGEQWHILSFLSKTWWGEPGTGYSIRELADYVYEVHRRGGVVSVDVVLFRDGSLDRSQIELLKAVRRELDDATPRQPVPPGNLAYRKQSQLLSLDGSHPLVVNSRVHFARLGVDGNLDTYALAANEWPWSYEVDLIDTVNIRRIKVTFGKGYATHFEFRLSADREAWTTVAAKSDHDGQPYEATFEPVPARYVRVSALKPDGPDQPGAQMSVAELEVYE